MVAERWLSGARLCDDEENEKEEEDNDDDGDNGDEDEVVLEPVL